MIVSLDRINISTGDKHNVQCVALSDFYYFKKCTHLNECNGGNGLCVMNCHNITTGTSTTLVSRTRCTSKCLCNKHWSGVECNVSISVDYQSKDSSPMEHVGDSPQSSDLNGHGTNSTMMHSYLDTLNWAAVLGIQIIFGIVVVVIIIGIFLAPKL